MSKSEVSEKSLGAVNAVILAARRTKVPKVDGSEDGRARMGVFVTEVACTKVWRVPSSRRIKPN